MKRVAILKIGVVKTFQAKIPASMGRLWWHSRPWTWKIWVVRYSQVDHIIRHYLLLLTSIEQVYSIICLTVFKMLCPYSFHWHAQLLDTISFKGTLQNSQNKNFRGRCVWTHLIRSPILHGHLKLDKISSIWWVFMSKFVLHRDTFAKIAASKFHPGPP